MNVLLDQQSTVLADLEGMVQRTKQKDFNELLPAPFVKVITGIRRSGKSTLMLQAVKNHQFFYVNFDDERLVKLTSSHLQLLIDIAAEISPHANFFLFDEIQNVEGWELFVNRLKREKKNILITGSNSRLLSSELASHLTGRHVSLELMPFSFKEFLSLKKFKIKESLTLLTSEEKNQLEIAFRNYMMEGGFPEALTLTLNSKARNQYLFELYDKIIGRDILYRRNIKHLKSLKQLASLLYSQNAKQFTFQSLKRSIQTQSINTIKNYVDYIEESYLGFVLEPFSFKPKMRISLPKKFYAIDPSLTDQIIGNTNQELGSKLESLVYLELRRRDKNIFNLLTKNYEVDFLTVEHKKITELIQVSLDISDPLTKQRELKALALASDEYRCNHLILITLNEEGEEKISEKVIKLVPAWKWFLE